MTSFVGVYLQPGPFCFLQGPLLGEKARSYDQRSQTKKKFHGHDRMRKITDSEKSKYR